jgi:uncharacterized membrane protein
MLALLAAVLVLMAFTPLGYLKVGPLSITFNTIPVAIGALALGPVCGAVLGAVFGLTSFSGGSALVMSLMSINPIYTAILCFVPRILEGLIAGFIGRALRKTPIARPVAYGITGFCTAFLNTLLFMSTLVILFGNTSYIQDKWTALAPGKNVILFVLAFVGVNAIVEFLSTTVVTSAIGMALHKAKFID